MSHSNWKKRHLIIAMVVIGLVLFLAQNGNTFTLAQGDATFNGRSREVGEGIFSAQAVNAAPTANAGQDQTITVADVAFLNGLVSDDGLPNPPGALELTWSQVSGPGTVAFGNSDESLTTAAFPGTGTYVLRLTVSDGQSSTSDDATVTVIAAHPNTLRVPQDYATIQAAISAAQHGDLVLVSAGTYVESLYLNKSITLASEFYTTGDPSHIAQTIISGPDINEETVTVSSGTGPATQVVGFTIRDGKDGVKIRGIAKVFNNHFLDLDTDAVDFSEDGAGLVQDNVMENNGDDGVDIDHAAVLIQGNLMQSNDGDAVEIRLFNTSYQLTIIMRDNDMLGNIQDGIQLIDNDVIGATKAMLIVDRNVIANNVQAGFGMMDNKKTSEDYRAASVVERIHLFNNTFVGNNHGVTGGDNLVALNNIFVGHPFIAVKQIDGNSIVAYNLFWNNGTNNLGSNVDNLTSVFADPLLDASFQLLAGSPAIDAGTALFTLSSGETVLEIPPSDYDGAAPDIGRYEAASGPTNNPPVASDDSANTTKNAAVLIDVAANDTDPDGNLDPASANTACSGGSSGCADPANGVLSNHGDGSFTYTPNFSFTGDDGFTYEICDSGAPSLCDTAAVTVTVVATSSPPVANNDSSITSEDTAVTIDVAANDNDPDGNLDPATANATCANGSTGCNGASNGTLISNGNGTITYTPLPDFYGSDNFVYEICDTGAECDTAMVTVNVTALPDAPVANDDSATTSPGVPVTIAVAANDTDPDGNLNPASANTSCSNGSTGCAGPTNGLLSNHGNGSMTYNPDPGFAGSDSFVYEICDTTSLCDTATVTITVGTGPNAPVANNDNAQTAAGTAVTIDVAANDTDSDGNLNPASANTSCSNGSTGCTGPNNGLLSNHGNGTFTYTPNPGFAGNDGFVYEICDTTMLCDTATVAITVASGSNAPVANDDNAQTPAGTPVTIDVAANDTDPDGNLDPATANITCSNGSAGCSGPANGLLSNHGNGTMTYNPNPGFVGIDGFVYEICDATSQCDTASVVITVIGDNVPPVANADQATTGKGTPLLINVTANDTDANGNLNPSSANTTCANGSAGCSGPAQGTLSNHGNGTFTYNPNAGFVGNDSFVYEVCDLLGLCDTATVSITVTATYQLWLPVVTR